MDSNYNSTISDRIMNPGPGTYSNLYDNKTKSGGFKIPISNWPKEKSITPGPGHYKVNDSAIRGKSPSAMWVMSEVDRMVSDMNKSHTGRSHKSSSIMGNSQMTSQWKKVKVKDSRPSESIKIFSNASHIESVKKSNIIQRSIATATTRPTKGR